MDEDSVFSRTRARAIRDPFAASLVKDVISGLFLLMENQFGVGDIVNSWR